MRRLAVLLFFALFASLPAHGACLAPSSPTVLHSPTDILTIGQSYAIIWSKTAGDRGSYIVERSTSDAFDAEIEAQYCSTDTAAFIASRPGTYYHRVQAVAECDPALRSTPSGIAAVVVGQATVPVHSGRAAAAPRAATALPAPPGQSMLIVPSVVSLPGANASRFVTVLRLQNMSSWEIEAELVFVQASAPFPAGGAPAIAVSIPPNGAVTFDDVLTDPFGLTGMGSLEVRVPDTSADALAISAPLIRRRNGLAEAEFFLPVLRRNEGARAGVPHRVSGVVKTQRIRTNILLVETSRTSPAMIDARLFDAEGSPLGSIAVAVPQGSSVQLNDVGKVFGIGTLEAGSLEISVVGGEGTVAAILLQIDNLTQESAGCYVSEPMDAVSPGKVPPSADLATKVHAVLGAVHGTPSGSPIGYRTLLGLTSLETDTVVTLSLLADRALAAPRVTTTIPAGTTVEFPDALREIFRLSPTLLTRATILVQTTGRILVYGSLVSPDRPADSPIIGNLPTLTTSSEALVGAVSGLQRPISFTGLEQLVDPSTGGSWALELTELAQAPAVVTVHLYDASNRSAPVAKKDVALMPRQHVVMDTIFQAMGLEDTPPVQNRRDVQVVVFAKSGTGRVTAVAVGSYEATGRQARYILTPSGGIAADGTSLAARLLPECDTTRHHPTRR